MSVPISEVQKIVSDAYHVFVEAREKVNIANKVLNHFEFNKAQGLLEEIDEYLTKVLSKNCELMNELESKKKSEEK